jgi:hypothetical protein
VDDAASEVEIGIGNRDVILEAAEEVDCAVLADSLDDLTSSNVGEGGVGQMSVRKGRGNVVDAGRQDSAVDGVVIAAAD